MHRCLAIPEVLDSIFSNELCTSKALWRLARTCKAFHEPAIRNLWRHLANFDPILSLLPRDIMALDNDALVTGIIHIDWCVHKARIKSALERIQHYARYIRRLDWGWAYKYSSPPKYAVHHSVFRKLYEHEDCPRPLFPNLKEVVIPYPKNDPLVAVFYPSLVLSPSVRTIEVVAEDSTSISLDANHTDSTDGRWTSLASRLFKMAPHLEVFEVAAGGAFRGTLSFYGKLDAFERQVLPNFSSRMTRLKLASLVLGGSTFSALGGGHLVGLVKLSISLAEQQYSQLLCESSTTLSFPSLERLSISVLPLKTCQAFLELLDTTKLKELKLKVYMDSDDEGNEQGDDYNPQPLFKALIGRGNTCLEDISLKKIWINEDAEHLWYACIDERVFTVAPETVQPLLAFSKLSSLSIEPCDTSALDDDTLSTMLSSWPSLQTLELADHTFAFEPPVLTLVGVHKALQCVPSLEILSIRFDGSIIPPHDPLHSFISKKSSRLYVHTYPDMYYLGMYVKPRLSQIHFPYM
ncbi:hypothetical protein BKA70DRAFT_1184866 [Coprinopsis sp. MPI-PUGE-AT-0042]|nr:hypothetical protein BKA70DRAFT_1184866 [Coprinopsis sp. MPI-PUGE-AT-0042]